MFRAGTHTPRLILYSSWRIVVAPSLIESIWPPHSIHQNPYSQLRIPRPTFNSSGENFRAQGGAMNGAGL